MVRLNISNKDEFDYDWYDDSLTSEDIGNILITNIDKEIEKLKKDKENVFDIYIKQ